MQGMLHALGMERMLSPSRGVPLPRAMTTYLTTDRGEELNLLESNVSLEIENGAEQIITITRPIKSIVDHRLVTVEFGAALTDETATLQKREFFVRDPGAASREDGFHFFLEGFMGWDLPMVRRYDAPETKLYLETIFPLFWVEQKTGWSSIPAAIPTYLRIREVHKRAVEFILDLDVHKLELRRQQLDDLFAANTREWRAQWEELDRYARRNGAKIEGLPQAPTASENDFPPFLLIAEHSTWTPLPDLDSPERPAAELSALNVPTMNPPPMSSSINCSASTNRRMLPMCSV